MALVRSSAEFDDKASELDDEQLLKAAKLLKLSNLAESGADARELLLTSGVTVNGDPEARRGRQLHRGDVVAIGEHAVRVV